MPKITETKQNRGRGYFDVSAKFPDGSSFKIVQSANGMKVTTKPDDRALTIRMEIGVSHAMFPPSGMVGLKLFDQVEAIAKASFSLTEFSARYESDLGIDVDKLLPEPRADERTITSLKSGRSQELQIHFPSGEVVGLTINKSSIALKCRPDSRTLSEDISKFVFGVKAVGVVDDAELASRLEVAATDTGSIDGWLEAAKQHVFGDVQAPKPR